MTFLQRVKNLWLLSEYQPDLVGGVTGFSLRKPEQIKARKEFEVSHMAQIVKMANPKDKFLKDNQIEDGI